jgi:hypothetical protein
MTPTIWSLPGPGRFIEAIRQSVLQGETPLILVPASLDLAGARGALVKSLEPDGWRSPLDAVVTEFDSEGHPLDVLMRILNVEIDAHERLDAVSFVKISYLHRRLVLLDLRALQSRDSIHAWGRFLVQIAAAMREVPATQRCALCAVAGAPGASILPDQEASIRRHWWWGVVSRLDSEVFAASRFSHVDSTVAAAAVEIAAFDIDFAEVLLSEWDGVASKLDALVEEYAAGTEYRDLPRINSLPRFGGKPPTSVIEYWNRGLLNAWSEIDPCLHAVVPHPAGRDSTNQRIWRSQLRVVFPQLEQERQRLATWVANHKGLERPTWVEGDVESLEIGPLWKLIRENRALRIDSPRADLARWLKGARDRLAHMDLLTREDITEGQRFMEAVWERESV